MMMKYRAKPTVIDGIRFASGKEAARYSELQVLLRGRMIKDFELQPKFPIVVAGLKICTYIADFRYWDIRKGCSITEDVKGFKTPMYRLKKKLVKAVHLIDIVET